MFFQNLAHGKKFYLVVSSPGLFDLRQNLLSIYQNRASPLTLRTDFNPQNFWPHITIGFVKNDIHEVNKGSKTCLPGTHLIVN